MPMLTLSIDNSIHHVYNSAGLWALSHEQQPRNTGSFSLDKGIEHIRKCDWICPKIQDVMEVGTTGWFRVQVLLLVPYQSEKG